MDVELNYIHDGNMDYAEQANHIPQQNITTSFELDDLNEQKIDSENHIQLEELKAMDLTNEQLKLEPDLLLKEAQKDKNSKGSSSIEKIEL